MVKAGQRRRLLYALAASNGISLVILTYRSLDSGSWWFGFLAWNLLLAWIPAGLAWWLVQRLGRSNWQDGGNVLLTALWLIFLPNSFYLASDFIHIGAIGLTLHDLVMDAAMLLSFTANAYIAGFISLFLVHKQILKRIARPDSHALIGVILTVCGFAIYLGRVLRWNSWDVVLRPVGLVFDVSELVLRVENYPDLAATITVFTLLTGGIYAVIWQFIQYFEGKGKK